MNILKDPVPQLIQKIAIPASLGLFFNTMYNVVDTFYGGQISIKTLSALSLTFPIFLLVLSVGMGLSAGTATLIGVALGKGEEKEALHVHAQGLLLGVISSVVLSIAVLFFLEPFLLFFGAEGETLLRAIAYIRIIVRGTLLFVLLQLLNSALSARGDTVTNLNFLITGFFLNLLLDPLLLYGTSGFFEKVLDLFLSLGINLSHLIAPVHSFFSAVPFLAIPPLEEQGIALATVLIQLIGVVYTGYICWRRRLFSGLSLRDFLPKGRMIRELFSLSLPAALNMLTIALGVIVINRFLSLYGDTALAAYGTAIRIEQIALIPSFGLNIALSVIVAQCFGAKDFKRLREGFKVSLRYGMILWVTIVPIVLLFAGTLFSIFTKSERMISIGRDYLTIQGITFFSYVLMGLANSVLQGIKKPGMIFWIGIYRQIVAPLAVYALFNWLWGLMGIWWGIVAVTWSAAIFTYWHTKKNLVKAEKEEVMPNLEKIKT